VPDPAFTLIPREKTTWIYVPIGSSYSFGYNGRVVLAKMQRQQDTKTLGDSGAKTYDNIDSPGNHRNGYNRCGLAVIILG
jgi:hypothetical protein